MLLDVNVVVAAGRGDHAHHPTVRPWFDDVLAGDEPITVPDGVWASFVRIVTNRRAFADRSTVEEAFAFLRSVREQPLHEALVPGEEHLAIFERLCVDFDVSGELVPDAYLAALALEHGCTLVSLDRDFARFEGLDWRRPVP